MISKKDNVIVEKQEKHYSFRSQGKQSSFSEYFKSSQNESEAKTRNEISISVNQEKGIISI